jgi:D-alanine-D-alanine ligase
MKHGRVLILYNAVPARTGKTGAEAEAGVLHEVEAVESALRCLGLEARRAAVSRLADVPGALAGGGETAVFNLVESLDGGEFESPLVPAVCRAAGRAVTGCDSVCQVLGLDKWQARAAVAAAGVRVPLAVVALKGCPLPADLPVPRVIVKPLRADASEGIDALSVAAATDRAAVAAAVERVHARFGYAALIEEYVEGREIGVSLFEAEGEVRVLPPAEIVFDGAAPDAARVVDYRAKWVADSAECRSTRRVVPAPLDGDALDRLSRAATAVWHALGCRDYARVDFRLAADGEPYAIDVNPNPDIAPDAGFAAALAAGGVAYHEFVRAALDNALRRRREELRQRASPWAEAPPAETTEAAGRRFLLRWSVPADREELLELTVATGVFHDHEAEVAREVLDSALAEGPAGHYQCYTAAETPGGRPVGWVCFGPTPCTAGTFDLYWMAVERSRQRSGVGRLLLALAEKRVRERGGRQIIVETSSRDVYAGTWRFYERAGFTLAARIPDFYGQGDDKLVYSKRAAAAG